MALESLTDRELLAIRQAFAAFDHTREGVILRADLTVCLKVLGHTVSDKEVGQLIEEFAPSGRVDYMALLHMLAKIMSSVKTPAGLVRAFRVFDPDKNGYVTAAEFRRIMGGLGPTPLVADQVDPLLEYADPEDTGVVYYEAFVTRLFADKAALDAGGGAGGAGKPKSAGKKK